MLIRKSFICLLTFFLPSPFCILLLRILGAKIGKNVKIGFSFIGITNLVLEDNVKIGHFNIILNHGLHLHKNVEIGYLNIFKEPFKIFLKNKAAIGNKNYITRGPKGVSYGESVLELGEITKITTGHHIDMTRSVKFGDFSILAGIRSQLWTHGYYHSEQGKDRIRIDGEISICNNVYIGSNCVFNPGVKVSDAIHIGGGSVISKNLTKSGMYVSHGLRFIENDLEKVKAKLKEVKGFELVEPVYTKE